MVDGVPRMRRSVTVFACRSLRSSGFVGLRMRAVGVGILSVSMAVGTRDFLRRRFVREALYVLVAIHAGEHGTVHGLLELCRIDAKGFLLTVGLCGESLVRVAGETIFIFGLMFGASCEDPAKQK